MEDLIKVLSSGVPVKVEVNVKIEEADKIQIAAFILFIIAFFVALKYFKFL